MPNSAKLTEQHLEAPPEPDEGPVEGCCGVEQAVTNFDIELKRKPQPLLVQIWDMFLIEMTNWRWSWRSIVIIGAVAPLLSMVALSVFARDSGAEALAYILTGNIVLSLMFGL